MHGIAACSISITKQAGKEIQRKLETDILVNGAGGNSPDATTKVEIMDGSENPEDIFGLKTEGLTKSLT